MSRPFSYNDENFTVIGNLLFVHLYYKNNIKPNVPIIKVPPEIVKRLCSLTNRTVGSTDTSGIFNADIKNYD